VNDPVIGIGIVFLSFRVYFTHSSSAFTAITFMQRT